MKLDRRLAVVEAGLAPAWKFHTIMIWEPGYLEDPESVWDAKIEEALDLYGRERIGPKDTVIQVRFIKGGDE